MRALRYHEFGEPDVLRVEDVPAPRPGHGQVLLRVAATSFNPVDASIRAGGMQGPIPVELPHVPGIDVAGTVEALGEGVTGWEVGDAVVAFLPMVEDGAAAELALAPADALAHAPSSLPLADTAALPIVGLTAWQALFEHAGLQEGQRLLVSGASGAVGGYATQLASRASAHVIALASERGADGVRERGADEVVDRDTPDPAGALGEPVDVLLNLAPVDPARLEALAGLVRDGGVVVNTTVWMPAPSDEARGVRGVDLFVRSDAEQLAELVRLVDAGELRLDVAERVDLDGAADLHARAAAGALHGKAVIVVGA